MPDHSAGFEASGGGLTLTNAILLYRNERPGRADHHDDAAAFGSYHAVERDAAGSPTIAAGTPLTRAQLRGWSEALGRVVRPEFLPEHVLVSHPELLA